MIFTSRLATLAALGVLLGLSCSGCKSSVQQGSTNQQGNAAQQNASAAANGGSGQGASQPPDQGAATGAGQGGANQPAAPQAPPPSVEVPVGTELRV